MRVTRSGLRLAIFRIARSVYLSLSSFGPLRRRVAPHLDGLGRPFRYTLRGAGIDQTLTVDQLAGRRVLVIGVGPAAEMAVLARSSPRHLIGIDLQPSPDWWNGSAPSSTFVCANGTHLPLSDDSVDVVTSRSVLEHVVDLGGLLDETARVLKAGGTFHSLFGPLWHTFGGSHVSELAYDHLLVDRETALVKARSVGAGWEHWLELDLFNRLCLDEYLEEIERRFRITRLVIADSRDGRRFRKAEPERWRQLTARYSVRDLLVRLVAVTARVDR